MSEKSCFEFCFFHIALKFTELPQDKIVIGHAVYNDFKVLHVSPPPMLVRDTASSKPLREMAGVVGGNGGTSLKKLSQAVLG